MKIGKKIFVPFLLAITLFFSFSDTIQSLLSQGDVIEIEFSEEEASSEKDFDEIYSFTVLTFSLSKAFQINIKLGVALGKLNYQEPTFTINTPPPELA